MGISESDANAFMDESADVSDLSANPLLLSLLCILYRGEGSLPNNRAEAYEQCADLMFRRWDARRRIHLELRAGHLVEPTLRHLAWWIFNRAPGRMAVTENELVREATSFLRGRGFESDTEAARAATEFVEFCRGRMWVFSDVGTTANGEHLYSFTHRTFMEYFAAYYLASTNDTPEALALALAPKIIRSEWEMVGQLSVQIKDRISVRGAERVITALIDGEFDWNAEERANIARFARECAKITELPPSLMRRLAN